MRVDGKLIAAKLLDRLKIQVNQLKQKNILPHLAVVLVGDNPDSLTYIKQKQKSAITIGIRFSLYHLTESTAPTKLSSLVKNLAKAGNVHALIVQRPLPNRFDTAATTELVPVQKDVDGFGERSQFYPPIALSVIKILNEIYFTHIVGQTRFTDDFTAPFISWLKSKHIVLIGIGDTAGFPISNTFVKNDVPFAIVTSKSPNREEILIQADIIITAVGKSEIITVQQIKTGVIIIGVGLHSENGKLRNDYVDADIAQKAAFYTPTPGGTGPVNVASLMENVVKAAQTQG